jgi:hypothetical protein
VIKNYQDPQLQAVSVGKIEFCPGMLEVSAVTMSPRGVLYLFELRRWRAEHVFQVLLVQIPTRALLLATIGYYTPPLLLRFVDS